MFVLHVHSATQIIPVGTINPPTLLDFNGDFVPDLYLRNKTSGDNWIWLMKTGPSTYTNWYPNFQGNMGGSSTNIGVVAIADFNGDQNNDVVWESLVPYIVGTNILTGPVTIARMIGAACCALGTSTIAPWFGTNWWVVGAADFNRDGKADILWEEMKTGVKAIWYMDGSTATNLSPALAPTGNVLLAQSFGDVYNINNVGTNLLICATADFNRDGFPDIVVRDQTTGYIGIWYMNTDPTNGIQLLSTNLVLLGTNGIAQPDLDYKIVAAADVNHDGNPDLIWHSIVTGENGVWYMTNATVLSIAGGSGSVATNFDPEWRINSQFYWNSYWRLQNLVTNQNSLLTAASSASPLTITLTYQNATAASLTTTIQRKLTTAASWTTISSVSPPVPATIIYTDSNIVSSNRYEYQFFSTNLFWPFTTNNLSYTVAGIQATPIEGRGRIIMLVDTQVVASLTVQLGQLTKDLVGDGWQVISNSFARHDDITWSSNPGNITSIKAFITSAYNTNPATTKGVFLIGHLAIPYSGLTATDGHTPTPFPPDHQGAWPADAFYGDVNGTWNDSSVNYNNLAYPTNSNVPLDGKYDADNLPSPLEMFVGRVDFANLPSFGTTGTLTPTPAEINLLSQYLDKDHKFRTVQAPFPLAARGVTFGSFGIVDPIDSHDADFNHPMYTSALENCGAFFGTAPGNLVVGDPFYQRTCSYLWGFATGFGHADQINAGTGVYHQTTNFTIATNIPPVAFFMLFGSYFGDWNIYSDDVMRGALAGPTNGLAAVWNSGWQFEGMAMGDTLGSGMLRTLNIPKGSFYGPREGTILGDPTLRHFTIPPPVGLTGAVTSVVVLTWNTNNAPGVKYSVYKSSGTGPFVSITPNPIAGPSAVDASSYNAGTNYMVRGLKLQTSGSGTYTNISQGSFWP